MCDNRAPSLHLGCQRKRPTWHRWRHRQSISHNKPTRRGLANCVDQLWQMFHFLDFWAEWNYDLREVAIHSLDRTWWRTGFHHDFLIDRIVWSTCQNSPSWDFPIRLYCRWSSRRGPASWAFLLGPVPPRCIQWVDAFELALFRQLRAIERVASYLDIQCAGR